MYMSNDCQRVHQYPYILCISVSLTDEKPEKIILMKLRPTVEHPWRRLADLERLLCFSAAKMTETAYTSTSTV